jgi:hypothetical protein
MATHSYLMTRENALLAGGEAVKELWEALRIEKEGNGGTIQNANLPVWREVRDKVGALRAKVEGFLMELSREFA